ncbi:MAG: hypothetical protein ACT4R6_08910 [Gemmatimonadaceae bacterium]
MRSRFSVLGAAVAPLLASAPAMAQGAAIDAQCPASTMSQRATQDACQKALDTFRFMAPQLGISIAGGNATLGQGAAFGALGKFSVGLRANVIQGRVPRVDLVTPSPTGAASTNYQVEERPLGLPAVDAALGVFPGLSAAGFRVLALDLLANLAYVPDVTEQDVSISAPDGSLKLGFGGRLGLIQESAAAPGLSLSYLRRDLPRLDLVGQAGNDRLAVRQIEVETGAWRLTLQKAFGPVALVLGAGRDSYTTSAIADVEVQFLGQTFRSGDIQARQEMDRDNIFADVALNLPVLKIAAELGYVRGGTVETFNRFGPHRADDSLPYGALGIRIAF